MLPPWITRLFWRTKNNPRQPELEAKGAHRVGSEPEPEKATYGLKTLYNCGTAEVDIVAVHGLNGRGESTFTAANGTCWLKSLLPKKSANIRVLCYSYDTRTDSSLPLSWEHLHGHAEELIEGLRREREITETTRRPIIFIGHGLGGLIIKTALILSASYTETHFPSRGYIKVSTYGILFMGTPHQDGEEVAWDMMARNIERPSMNSGRLERLQELFLPISNEFKTTYFYETYPTPIPGRGGRAILVVPKHSACIPGALGAARIAIQSDHTGMVKFGSAGDDGFRKVYGELFIMLAAAPRKIEENWKALASSKHFGAVANLP